MINAGICAKSWLITMCLKGFASISIEAINPFQPCPGPGLAFIPDSLLAGYQGSRLVEVYVGIIFFRCRDLVWRGVVQWVSCVRILFFWILEEDIYQTCSEDQSWVPFLPLVLQPRILFNRFNLHHWLAPVVLCLNHFLLPPVFSPPFLSLLAVRCT